MHKPLSALTLVLPVTFAVCDISAQPPLRAALAVRPSYQGVTVATRDVGARATKYAVVFDTGLTSSRRSMVTVAIVGALVGGLASAGYILNATAEKCATIGPPCPKKNHVVLHTLTIAAGASAGPFLAAKLGRWIGKQL
jgi:hypothetical protein